MNVVQISVLDTEGARFNGQDLHIQLQENGHESTHLVWNKRGSDPTTRAFCDHSLKEQIYRQFSKLERQLSVQSVLQPFAFGLTNEPEFQNADLAHYHLIHTGYFNLFALPPLSRKKPAVWTLHDPWALTGHCVHPFECTRWKTGCGNCPSLDSEFAMRRDNTHLMWKLKQFAYENSDLDIVVCSKWMKDMALASPLLKRSRVHHIPLGLNLDIFKPRDGVKAKQKLGVRPGNTVIALRATTSIYKGFNYAVECLRKLSTDVPLTILAFNQKGLLEEFFGKYQIIDVGWLSDTDDIVDAYNASDIFLMPSEGESFGLMATEAMACEKPTLIFEGTALTETTFVPEYGLSVPKHDTDALAFELKRLIENPSERRKRGVRGRQLALEHYDEKKYVSALITLYKEVLSRRQGLASKTVPAQQNELIEQRSPNS